MSLENKLSCAELIQRQRRAEDLILQTFRKFLLRQFSKGNLPQAVQNLSDANLRTYLTNPATIKAHFPEFAAPEYFKKVLELASLFLITQSGADNVSESSAATEVGSPKEKRC